MRPPLGPLTLVTPPGSCDIAVVGAGIIGLATARELQRRDPVRRLVVLEREPQVGSHQTTHNSGVIHAGIYYRAGSLKAQLCTTGARELYEFCEERGIPHERVGKLIVARHDAELGRLDELERRGRENGVPGLRRLTAAEISEVEPHCRGVAALHSPFTGIADFAAVARAFADDLRHADVPVVTGCEVTGVRTSSRDLTLEHAQGRTEARFAVFCAGARSDRQRQSTYRRSTPTTSRAGSPGSAPRRSPATAAWWTTSSSPRRSE